MNENNYRVILYQNNFMINKSENMSEFLTTYVSELWTVDIVNFLLDHFIFYSGLLCN